MSKNWSCSLWVTLCAGCWSLKQSCTNTTSIIWTYILLGDFYGFSKFDYTIASPITYSNKLGKPSFPKYFVLQFYCPILAQYVKIGILYGDYRWRYCKIATLLRICFNCLLFCVIDFGNLAKHFISNFNLSIIYVKWI